MRASPPIFAVLGLVAACGGRARYRSPDVDASVDAGAVDDAAPDSGCHDDRDGDTHDSPACGGRDCDDSDPLVRPNAPDPGEWLFEPADQLGWDVAPALAVEASGAVHVVFEDRAAGAVVHAVRTGEDLWEREAVEAGGRAPAAVLAEDGVAADGALHVVFAGGGDSIRHAVRSAGAWTATQVAIGRGGEPGGPAVARHGAVLIGAFADPAGVRIARLVDGEWSFEDVAADGPAPDDDPSVAVAVHPDGRAVLAWTVGETVQVVEESDALEDGWETEILPVVGGARWPALAIGPDGPVVACEEVSTGGLVVAGRAGTAWSVGSVDPDQHAGRASALAIDPDGYTHVVYFAESRFDTRYATNRHGDWLRVPLDRSGEPDLAIAIEPGGTIHLVYATTDSDLHWARHVPDDGVDQNCNGLPDDGG